MTRVAICILLYGCVLGSADGVRRWREPSAAALTGLFAQPDRSGGLASATSGADSHFHRAALHGKVFHATGNRPAPAEAGDGAARAARRARDEAAVRAVAAERASAARRVPPSAASKSEGSQGVELIGDTRLLAVGAANNNTADRSLPADAGAEPLRGKFEVAGQCVQHKAETGGQLVLEAGQWVQGFRPRGWMPVGVAGAFDRTHFRAVLTGADGKRLRHCGQVVFERAAPTPAAQQPTQQPGEQPEQPAPSLGVTLGQSRAELLRFYEALAAKGHPVAGKAALVDLLLAENTLPALEARLRQKYGDAPAGWGGGGGGGAGAVEHGAAGLWVGKYTCFGVPTEVNLTVTATPPGGSGAPGGVSGVFHFKAPAPLPAAGASAVTPPGQWAPDQWPQHLPE
jgi:hypothetical protein